MAILVWLLLPILLTDNTVAEKQSAFFIFGDSTVDAGNNNFIETIPENKANYDPYGRNALFPGPTGRFSDGLIVVDYLAEYAKLPMIPPFLDPSASDDLSHGVNFASGGSGILSTTNEGQELYKKGARKFGFLGLSPLGCLPVMRAIAQDGCFEQANLLALAHNNALTTLLNNLEYLLKDFKYSNSDFYTWLLQRITDPSTYGFKEGASACCGSGPFGGIFSCGGMKETTAYDLCDDANDYVWWDSYHPTQRIHQHFGQALWDGPQATLGPYSLRDLFFGPTTIADVVDADHSTV
ncbi:hypothetical protein SASPL_129695 [Salvia splendens]|uniref:Zeta-carotene desaturase n=1 Tax=Salvia splendens TaxID=180675 RepID=A0A8X8ZNQ2_SALSN|nr:hypothetical protein SASPL_129695 [Salvia splendens]